jgi:hypothetical protein
MTTSHKPTGPSSEIEAAGILYRPDVPANWPGGAPQWLDDALDKLAGVATRGAVVIPDDGAAAAGALPTFAAPKIGDWSADSTVLDVSNRVQTWTDLSGNGNDLTQATGGLRGLARYDQQLRNRRVIECDGVGTFWSNAAIKVAGANPPAYSNYTLLALLRFYTTTNGQAAFAGTDSTGLDNTHLELLEQVIGGVHKVIFTSLNTFGAAALYPYGESYPPVADPFTRWHSFVGRQASASRSLSIDGGTPVVGTGVEAPGSLRHFHIGKLAGGSYYYFSGAIARVVLLGGDVSTAELANWTAFVAAYYGLSS